jgi:D-glycero-alpha-D-manno-heptose-7-phosphate kinase
LIHPQELAEQACQIEIERLGEPVGKQDQYIAAFGGLTCFRFTRDGVKAWPLALSEETRLNLTDNLVMYFTGYSRNAASVLNEQDTKTRKGDGDMINNLHYVKELGLRSKEALESGNLTEFGRILHEHWLHKRRRSAAMSNTNIDAWYDIALANGAIGGKLIGAGGGGFLLFYTEDKRRLRHAMMAAGLKEVPFRFDFLGTQVVVR